MGFQLPYVQYELRPGNEVVLIGSPLIHSSDEVPVVSLLLKYRSRFCLHLRYSAWFARLFVAQDSLGRRGKGRNVRDAPELYREIRHLIHLSNLSLMTRGFMSRGNRRQLRYAKRKVKKRRILTNRTASRRSTRALAKRAFVTRGSIKAVEYTPLYGYVDKVFSPYNNIVSTYETSADVTRRFFELSAPVSTDPTASLSPLFNCFPDPTELGNLPATVNQFRVLGGKVKLKFHILETTDPADGAGIRSRVDSAYNKRFPPVYYCRIIGVKQYEDTGVNGDIGTYIPAYHAGSFAFVDYAGLPLVGDFLTDPTKNYFNTADVFKCDGNEDWIHSRAYDYTDPHKYDRTRNRSLVYDKIFRMTTNIVSTGGYQTLPSGAEGFRRDTKTVTIRFPSHVVNLPSGIANVRRREDCFRFYMCIYQQGTTASSDVVGPLVTPFNNSTYPVRIRMYAKSKFFYAYSSFV